MKALSQRIIVLRHAARILACIFGSHRRSVLEVNLYQLILFWQQRVAVSAVHQRVFRLKCRADGFHQFGRHLVGRVHRAGGHKFVIKRPQAVKANLVAKHHVRLAIIHQSVYHGNHVCPSQGRLFGNLRGHLPGGNHPVVIRLGAIHGLTLARTDFQFMLSRIKWLWHSLNVFKRFILNLSCLRPFDDAKVARPNFAFSDAFRLVPVASV